MPCWAQPVAQVKLTVVSVPPLAAPIPPPRVGVRPALKPLPTETADPAANREGQNEDHDQPVHPGPPQASVQLCQFSCCLRARFLRFAAFILRLRRSLGFSKCW